MGSDAILAILLAFFVVLEVFGAAADTSGAATAGLPNPVVIDANIAALIAHSVVVSVHAINAGKDLQSLPCSVHGAGRVFRLRA